MTLLFQIRLEQDSLTLRGPFTESVGCVLRGQLVLLITKPINTEEIKLTFQGKSKIAWNSGNIIETSEKRILYRHDWVFLAAQEKYHVLQPANYCWNFELILPGTLKETIEKCNRSYIRYNLKATLKRPTFSQNIHTKRKIQINRCLMSNCFNLLQSFVLINSWENKVEYEFSIGTGYFCLDDKIPVELIMKPLIKGINIRRFNLIFEEHRTHKIGTKTMKEVIIINIKKYSSVILFDNETWIKNEEMSIPKFRCLADSENDQIRIKHKIRFNVAFQIKHKDYREVTASLPVIITPIGTMLDTLPTYNSYYFDREINEDFSSSIPSNNNLTSRDNNLYNNLSSSNNNNYLPSYDSTISLIPLFSQRVSVNSGKKPQMYGVILYMAPERFSLGMIMWELTTGRKPFHDRKHGPLFILDNLAEITRMLENFNEKTLHPNDIKEHYPDKYVIDILLELLEFKKAKKERLEMNKSHYNYMSIQSLDSMLESIINSSMFGYMKFVVKSTCDNVTLKVI
ncbi:11213_t:CDS:2 [Diversispora eburnea]|uniref:11213_t:CDS:1 n=1 Tax=Diversispora eburnea TaxID=1213867 RepID=A0A9N9G8Z3_9GLOM|nr:11213_t:CDS:2 [Diversispora eburnea]